ncbi:hypothetical protein [Herbaspirillum sp. ST 5-3]|uniref:hypothetical protein n=1 Tax=Oxalobacteraceae TaxID=75682 RepID=UPI0010A302F1|nr:hypothetical protein [Herbaspirillum sp. ST 5-3]
MHCKPPLIRLLFTRSLLALAVACGLSPVLCHAGDLDHDEDDIAQSLPELPGGDHAAPGYFDLARESAAVGYETRFETLNATLDQYFGLAPSVTLDYGLQLADKVGAGGIYRRDSTQSELVLNGIYAPKRNLRFRLTGAQLRSVGQSFDGESETVFQTSYLVGAKKYWNSYRYLSDIGIATYVVRANAAPEPITTDAESIDGSDMPAGPLPLGDLRGYRLDLGMQPGPQSRIEWRREIGRLTYFSDGDRIDASIVSNRVRYSHHLGDCTKLQGAYNTNSAADHMDLKLARNSWSLGVSQEMEGARATAISFSYAIPLGTSAHHQDNCNDAVEGPPRFAPLLDAAIQRPPQLPEEPLTTIVAP